MLPLKITTTDQNSPVGLAPAEHDAIVTADSKTSFQFKSRDFPSPALGRKFFVAGREIDVTELGMGVEEGKAMFYFSAEFVPHL